MSVKSVIFAYVLTGVNVLGLLFDIIGVAGIKWGYTTEDCKALYIICLILFLFTLAVSILFILIFLKGRINSNNKKICQIAAIAAATIALIGLILNIVSLAVANDKFGDVEDAYPGLVTTGEKSLMRWMMILTLFMFIFNIPLWILIILRIKKNVDPTVNTSTNSDVKVSYGTREINLH